jgi:hypothetical protein
LIWIFVKSTNTIAFVKKSTNRRLNRNGQWKTMTKWSPDRERKKIK